MPEEIVPKVGNAEQDAEKTAEIERLRAKQSTLDDEDIRLAIQARIDALESELKGRAIPTAEAEEALEGTPATPEQARQADNLIRQSRVEKMRGNSAKALTLMREAAALAPTSPTVLEALGDDLVERRQYKDAMATFKRALQFSPRNVSIETKLAQAALKLSGMGSIEQQLRMGDSAFISRSDAVASLRSARFFNALVPGVGHMVLGRTGTGVAILIGWTLCIGIVAAMQNDVKSILRMAAPQHAQPNLIVLLPLFLAILIWISAQAALGVEDRPSTRTKVDRPKPPVDLPFE